MTPGNLEDNCSGLELQRFLGSLLFYFLPLLKPWKEDWPWSVASSSDGGEWSPNPRFATCTNVPNLSLIYNYKLNTYHCISGGTGHKIIPPNTYADLWTLEFFS